MQITPDDVYEWEEGGLEVMAELLRKIDEMAREKDITNLSVMSGVAHLFSLISIKAEIDPETFKKLLATLNRYYEKKWDAWQEEEK